VPDDQDSRALEDLVQTDVPVGQINLSGVLASGTYKIHVTGRMNLYELSVTLTEAALQPDVFEPNDSFGARTRIILRDPGERVVGIFNDRPQGAGTWDLTLHKKTDQDFFRIDPHVNQPLSEPVVTISRADLPIDVTIFDSNEVLVEKRIGIRATKVILPRTETSYVQVSGNMPTRYRMTARLEIDQSKLPGPNQRTPSIPLPNLGDPAGARIDGDINHVLFHVDTARAAIGSLNLAAIGGETMKVDVLDSRGIVVQTVVSRGQALNRSVRISVKELPLGTYLLRIGHKDPELSLAIAPLHVEVIPSFF
jgi:hypothetical protein